PEEYQQYQEQLAQQPDPQMLDMMLKQADAARADRELALQEDKLRLEMQQAQQRELWEHEEKMGSNYARIQEAQAQVIKARSEVEADVIKLAGKDRQLAMKLQADNAAKQNQIDAQVCMERMRQESQLVTAQLNREDRQMDQLLKAKEMELKERYGTGV